MHAAMHTDTKQTPQTNAVHTLTKKLVTLIGQILQNRQIHFRKSSCVLGELGIISFFQDFFHKKQEIQ